MKQLELDLWGTLKIAAEFPERAFLEDLWTALDTELEHLNPSEQLLLAGDVISQITEIVAERSFLTLEEIESIYQDEGPIVSAEFFDKFVRQSMSVDFSQFVEAPPPLPRSKNRNGKHLFPNDGRSVVASIDKNDLLKALESQPHLSDEVTRDEFWDIADSPRNGYLSVPVEKHVDNGMPLYPEKLLPNEHVLAIAHAEDIPAWFSAIAHWMSHKSQSEAVSLKQLVEGLGMPLVEVWLGMLLGGEDQYKWDIHGDFYSHPDKIFINN